MRFVLDTSVTLAAFFKDEESHYADRVAEALHDGVPAFVPRLFRYELSNSLLAAERRGRILAEQSEEIWLILVSLPILSEPLFTLGRLEREKALLCLARDTGLTVYDAAYLQLADRLQLPIATLDRKLARAGETVGVKIFQP